MTLADKLQQPFFPNFPHFTSNFNWSSYNLDGLAINEFKNFRQVNFARNFTVYAGGPDDGPTETENYIEGSFSGVYFTDNNRNDNFDKDFDNKLADIRLFISHDGAFLLESYQKLKEISNDEIAIFLEVPKDDIFSDNVMLVKAGSNAIQYTEKILNHSFVNDRFTLTEEQIKSLLESVSSGQTLWSKVVESVNKVEDFVVDKTTDAGVYIFGEIADFFSDTIRLDEKRWNSSHQDYSLKDIEKGVLNLLNERKKEIDQLLEKYKDAPDWVLNILSSPKLIIDSILVAVQEIKVNIQEVWAFVCGLWNGFMDLLGGIFSLVKLLFQGVKAHHQYKQNEDYYKSLISEYLDNAIQAILKLDWKEVISKSLVSFLEFHHYLTFQLPQDLWNKVSDLNNTEVNYYSGYVVFNVLEFIIPPLKFAKLAKAGKLEKVVGILDEIAGFGKQVGKKADEVAEMFFNTINTIIKKLEEGTKSFLKFIDDIYIAIKKYLEDLFGVAKQKIDNFVNKLPSYLTKFINALPSSVQKSVVDGLLILHFKGKTLMKIDPRGVIVQIKYFRDLKDYKYFSELKSVKIELEIINEYGQKVKKTYKDTIEVMKKGDDVGFRAKFDEGKVRDSEYINYTFEKSNSNPPFATNPYTKSKVIDRYLKEGDEFYIVENLNQATPGSFLTNKPIFTIKELREELAVLESWKNIDPKWGELVIRKYKVLKEFPVRDGYIGPMLETTKGSKNFGKTYKGGNQQYETLTRFTDKDVYIQGKSSIEGKTIERIKDFTKTLK